MRFSTTPLLLLSSLGLFAGTALADGGRPRVTFYEDADFRGASRTIEVGGGLENLSRESFAGGAGMNDRISSFRIEGGAKVRAFQDAGFRGGMKEFDFSVRDLNDSAPGWNDAISSLRVEPDRGGPRPGGNDRPEPRPPVDHRPSGPHVTVYEHSDFRGASRTLEPGQALENLARDRFGGGPGMNDQISSIRIEGGAQILVYQDAGFRGDVRRFNHSVSDLNDSAPGWNDAISSLRVERDRGGPPPEPDFRRADDIIRRAYRDILRRDPDAGGLRDYRRHLVNDNWTEEQLRHSLRESGEFRNLADRLISAAYRDLLQRDPSKREREKFREQMVQRGSNENDVRNAIRNTDEFRMRERQKQGG